MNWEVVPDGPLDYFEESFRHLDGLTTEDVWWVIAFCRQHPNNREDLLFWLTVLRSAERHDYIIKIINQAKESA